ncbi:hypothetical protein M1K46_19530 [Fictibacillus sp. WQ 8-8]|uniref:hypothetical protein n=1 Tax=Fictibacillus sp. WQ 8-8 TaxID=2938788 RepID=UPI00210D019B|nr:hypothetical protein [Fictibacillus sp. WQ 8-8]MCQ6267822.1 hypothetical protein [Fictibacillus sp. WQ 8-8]
MASEKTKNQILEIEEQIKRLRDKQKRLVAKTQSEIGKYVMDTWNIQDTESAKVFIDLFKEQVHSSQQVATSDESTDQGS